MGGSEGIAATPEGEGRPVNRVSRKESNGVTSTARKPGATGGQTLVASPEPRREQGSRVLKENPKGPTSQQWSAMAGAMYNALEALRVAHGFIKEWTEKNEGWLDPLRTPVALEKIVAVENILRVGLKARFRK